MQKKQKKGGEEEDFRTFPTLSVRLFGSTTVSAQSHYGRSLRHREQVQDDGDDDDDDEIKFFSSKQSFCTRQAKLKMGNFTNI